MIFLPDDSKHEWLNVGNRKQISSTFNFSLQNTLHHKDDVFNELSVGFSDNDLEKKTSNQGVLRA